MLFIMIKLGSNDSILSPTLGPPNSGQKMALRAFYFIKTLTKALTYYYINRSQRHLLVAIENN